MLTAANKAALQASIAALKMAVDALAPRVEIEDAVVGHVVVQVGDLEARLARRIVAHGDAIDDLGPNGLRCVHLRLHGNRPRGGRHDILERGLARA